MDSPVIPSRPSGADAVARVLREEGVDTVFGLPGVHNMPLWPPLQRAGIRILGSRHEQGTVYAADGIARVTGQLGVALTTTGPGAANTLAAVGEAWASKSPVLVISPDIPTDVRRPGVYRGFVHECRDQGAMFRPVTKRVLTVRTAQDLAPKLRQAISHALRPPQGPVYVEIPVDLLETPVDPPADAASTTLGPMRSNHSSITRALDLIRAAERPLIWIGGGAREAGRAIDQLARRLGAPVVTTFQARGVLAPDHPHLLNLPPHEPLVTEVIEAADLGIVIGSDLDQMMTQAWRLPLPEPLIAINVDSDDATKNYPARVVVVGDAPACTEMVVAQLSTREPWAPDSRELEQRFRLELSETMAPELAFLEAVDRALPQEAVVFADMAICGYWLSAYWPARRPRSLHYPMGWGTLGFSFPAAIGAAASGASVVSFNGDGGMLFALGELALVAEAQLPLTIVVVDDSGYGMLRHAHEGDEYGTELLSPDFAVVARGFGIQSRQVEGVGEQFGRALAAGVSSGIPNVLHAKARLRPPRTTSPRWPLRSRQPVARAQRPPRHSRNRP